MALDPSNNRLADVKPDYDALLAQLSAIRDDMARMAGQMTDSVASHGAAMANSVSDTLTDARRVVGRQAHAADVRIEQAISANPYMALAMAAGLGLLLGAMARK